MFLSFPEPGNRPQLTGGVMNFSTPAVVIGMGNDFRSDDAAGLFIARKIREMNLDGVRVICGVSDGTSLIEAWASAQVAVVVDCVVSGAEAGHIYRFDGLKDDIPEKYFTGYSTHAFSVADTIGLAQAMNSLPGILIVYGIEGKVFKTGEGMTPEVAEAAEKLANEIADGLRSLTH